MTLKDERKVLAVLGLFYILLMLMFMWMYLFAKLFKLLT
jgi:hypothetical protein